MTLNEALAQHRGTTTGQDTTLTLYLLLARLMFAPGLSLEGASFLRRMIAQL